MIPDEIEPPVLVEAKHISLNAIRLTWTSEDVNVTDVTLTTNVVLARQKCDEPEQQVELEQSTQVRGCFVRIE